MVFSHFWHQTIQFDVLSSIPCQSSIGSFPSSFSLDFHLYNLNKDVIFIFSPDVPISVKPLLSKDSCHWLYFNKFRQIITENMF